MTGPEAGEATDLFKEGQVWRLAAPADPRIRVRIGAVETIGGRVGVHIEVRNTPIPDGFRTNDGAEVLSVGHVPITAEALVQAVEALEGEEAGPSPPFEEGYAQWRAAFAKGRAGFFDLPPHDIVNVLFEAFKRAQKDPQS